MAITRTAMIDDDGSGTTGTILNNAWKQELYNQIDGLFPTTWTPYTPLWTGNLTNPVLGNGTLVGTYLQQGGVTWFELMLTMGSTTTFGSGAWLLTAPTPIVTPAAFRGCLVVSGRVYDSSAGASSSIAGGTPVGGATFETYSYGGALAAVIPFAYAVGDIVQLAGAYRSL